MLPSTGKGARGQEGDLVAMSTLKAKRREWLWSQRIPFGAITLLTGKKGAGKSSLASEIAACVTSGRRLPGSNVRLSPMNVCHVVREEDVEQEPFARAEEQGADRKRLLVLPPAKPLPWSHVRDRASRMRARNDWLEDMIRRHHVRVLTADPITSLIVHETGNALRDELTELTILFAKYNVACIGIIHLTKSWGGTIIGTIRGGGQWSEVTRSILAVARLKPSDPRSPIVFGTVDINIAVGDVPYLAFRLEPHSAHRERVRLVWEDDNKLPPRISLDDLVKQACKEGKTLSTKSAQVDAALLEILANGVTLPEAEVKREVKQRVGAGDRTIEKRKRSLGIVSERHGGRWYWGLPTTVQTTPQPATEEEAPSPTTEAATGDGTSPSLPIADYVEQQQRKGKSATEIVAKLEAAEARAR